jgi:hypothetical protein
MQADPEFSTFARQWIDTVFGGFYASEGANEVDPQVLSDSRAQYLDLIERSEASALFHASKSAPSKPKTIRRRIFEWFERG